MPAPFRLKVTILLKVALANGLAASGIGPTSSQSPIAKNYASWRFTIKRAILTTFVTACMVLLPDVVQAAEYYREFPNAAIYIAWTEDKAGQVRGQVQLVRFDTANPAQLQSQNASFTGVRNGSDISIVFPLISNFSGQTWTGSIGWRSLTLVFPGSGSIGQMLLYPGSFRDFEIAEDHIRRTSATARAQQERTAAAAGIRRETIDAGGH